MEDRGVHERVYVLSEGSGVFGCRVNSGPLCSEEIKIKTYPIDKTSSERVQESLVVRDLLLVLQGYEGVYIRYNNSYSREMLVGPEYKVVKMMNVAFKSFSKKLIKIGSIYVKLEKFGQWCGEDRYGSVMHRLGYEVRRFLHEDYLSCVKELERRFQEDVLFSIRDLEMALEEEYVYKFKLLDRLVDEVVGSVKYRSEMDRVQMDFDNFMEDLKRDTNSEIDLRVLYDTRVSLYVKGGSLLLILQRMMEQEQGDSRHVKFLLALCEPLYEVYSKMFIQWMEHGQLADIHDEFLISDTVADVDDEKLSYMLDNERLWDTRYIIRKDGLLPQLQDKELLQKILMTGKIWSLIRVCCGTTGTTTTTSTSANTKNNGGVSSGGSITGNIFTNTTLLRAYVNDWYQRANDECVRMFYEGYHMDKFMQLVHDQSYVHGVLDQIWSSKFLAKSLFELTRSPNEATVVKIQRHFSDVVREVKVEDSYKSMLLQLTSLKLDTNPFFQTLRQFIDDQESQLLNADNFQQLKVMLVGNQGEGVGVGEEPQFGRTKKKKNSVPAAMYVQFDTSIPYPLNIIWTKPVMVQYQMIHRLIFILSYHERLLEDTWFEISKNDYWRRNGMYSVPPQENNMLKVQCIRLARVLHFQMRSMVKEKRRQVTTAAAAAAAAGGAAAAASKINAGPAAAAVAPATRERDLLTLQHTVQDHVTNIVSIAGLTSIHHIETQEATLHLIHSFIRFVASWRRSKRPASTNSNANTTTITTTTTGMHASRMLDHDNTDGAEEDLSTWQSRMDTLRQYMSVWNDIVSQT